MGCRPPKTPIDPNKKLGSEDKGDPVDMAWYQRLVAMGRLIYFYHTGQQGIKVFTHADWAGSIINQKSTSGYCTFLWGNLVTWRSKK